ncbi:hypothetical protein ACO0LG_16725 [Undibacterium sp. Ji42W]|uniref:hypothetical protein n=1 Tax=Undibacterium sp. Ji42W TaxID=3413039 RepID=UPI003BF3AEBA
MIRSTYTGRDGLPYFFPVLDDGLENEQADFLELPGGDSSSQAGMAALETAGRSDEAQAASLPQQGALTLAGGMSDTDDSLLLRTRQQADLPFNSWQRGEMRDDDQGPASWGEYGVQPMGPAMYTNEEGLAKAAGYTGVLADALQKHKRLDMPPPGLSRAQEAIWVQRQMIKNDFGLDETQFPNADYADFAKTGSPYYSRLAPENLRKLQWYVSQHIAYSQ